jgi:hypothetical protein
MTPTQEVSEELHDLSAIENKHIEILGDINILSDVLSLENKYGRNNICFCGSGKKFKKCCLPDHEEKERKLHELHLDMLDVQNEWAELKRENNKIEKKNRWVEEGVKVRDEISDTSNFVRKDDDTSEQR